MRPGRQQPIDGQTALNEDCFHSWPISMRDAFFLSALASTGRLWAAYPCRTAAGSSGETGMIRTVDSSPWEHPSSLSSALQGVTVTGGTRSDSRGGFPWTRTLPRQGGLICLRDLGINSRVPALNGRLFVRATKIAAVTCQGRALAKAKRELPANWARLPASLGHAHRAAAAFQVSTASRQQRLTASHRSVRGGHVLNARLCVWCWKIEPSLPSSFWRSSRSPGAYKFLVTTLAGRAGGATPTARGPGLGFYSHELSRVPCSLRV